MQRAGQKDLSEELQIREAGPVHLVSTSVLASGGGVLSREDSTTALAIAGWNWAYRREET